MPIPYCCVRLSSWFQCIIHIAKHTQCTNKKTMSFNILNRVEKRQFQKHNQFIFVSGKIGASATFIQSGLRRLLFVSCAVKSYLKKWASSYCFVDVYKLFEKTKRRRRKKCMFVWYNSIHMIYLGNVFSFATSHVVVCTLRLNYKVLILISRNEFKYFTIFRYKRRNSLLPFCIDRRSAHETTDLYQKCSKETLLQKFMTNLCLQSLNIFITYIKHRLYELYVRYIYCYTKRQSKKKRKKNYSFS